MYLALASMEKVSWGSGSACAARVLGLQPFVRHCSVAKEATLLDKCYITAVLAAQIECTCCLTPVVVWLRFLLAHHSVAKEQQMAALKLQQKSCTDIFSISRTFTATSSGRVFVALSFSDGIISNV